VDVGRPPPPPCSRCMRQLVTDLLRVHTWVVEVWLPPKRRNRRLEQPRRKKK